MATGRGVCGAGAAPGAARAGAMLTDQRAMMARIKSGGPLSIVFLRPNKNQKGVGPDATCRRAWARREADLLPTVRGECGGCKELLIAIRALLLVSRPVFFNKVSLRRKRDVSPLPA
jgi:hypothetical protein